MYRIFLFIYDSLFGNRLSDLFKNSLAILSLISVYYLVYHFIIMKDINATDKMKFERFSFMKIINYRDENGINPIANPGDKIVSGVDNKWAVYEFELLNDMQDIYGFYLESLIEFKKVSNIENKYGQDKVIVSKDFDELTKFNKGDRLKGYYLIKLDSVGVTGKSVLYWVANNISFEPKSSFSIRGKRDESSFVQNKMEYNLDLSELPNIVKKSWKGEDLLKVSQDPFFMEYNDMEKVIKVD